jgi:hypothetical protein
MAQAVSRRNLNAEAQIRSRVSPCGIFGGQSGTGTGFSTSTSVFPCQYHSTGAPLLGKIKKTDHLHYRVAQSALRLRCVRSICCGALHHKKNTDPQVSTFQSILESSVYNLFTTQCIFNSIEVRKFSVYKAHTAFCYPVHKMMATSS